MTAELNALTEREKATLRLIVRGHDAKSCARTLGLSVHTINERLREARRKLGVSSSREAARLLAEGEAPEKLGDKALGEDAGVLDRAMSLPTRRGPTVLLVGGGLTMLIALAALAGLTLAPQATTSRPEVSTAATSPAAASAEQWLALVDRSDWSASYAATGDQFRQLNTLEVWTNASLAARVPRGAVVARTLTGDRYAPAPPRGYRIVTFATRFAAGPATETVSLAQQGDGWRVVGYIIE